MDEDIAVVMETGERLPQEIRESDLSEFILNSPVFDGEKIVDEVSKDD